jgi:pyruvate dehydrogenase E1 component alpha subunit
MMQLRELYRQMARVRGVELAVADLWQRGLISGEMDLGTGEEAIAAGVVTLMGEGDALSLTHRGLPALVVRGVPLVPLLRELLGRPDGLCRGRGGHMHLFSRDHLAATSGIVGASAPLGAGLALAAKHLRKGSIAVSMLGEGAMNQGMALETLNLAVAWSLPLVLVCVDNGWSITTRTETVTGGQLAARARAFGWTAKDVDGTDVEEVHGAARHLIERCRKGKGPVFIRATCPRIYGHLLGDPLLEQSRHAVGKAARQTIGRILSAATERVGGGPIDRAKSAVGIVKTMARARFDTKIDSAHDPMTVIRRAMTPAADEIRGIDREVGEEVAAAVSEALSEEVRP